MRASVELEQAGMRPTGPTMSTGGGMDQSGVKLEIRNLTIAYPMRGAATAAVAVKDVGFAIRTQEFVCLLGPSGCGKSSILNVIAGLLRPTSGEILIDGKAVGDADRNRSVVFQSPALLPWRTALENARYGLDLWRVPRAKANARAKEMLELVGLGQWGHSFPHELSGGMQQRVNLARALAVDPEILLLDEPLAALDAQSREAMQKELLRVWTATQKTSLFVTHQIDEAVLLADRVIVLGRGPGHVKEIIAIDLPRPRDDRVRRERAFFEYEDRIRSLIRSDTLGAG